MFRFSTNLSRENRGESVYMADGYDDFYFEGLAETTTEQETLAEACAKYTQFQLVRTLLLL